MAIQTSTERQPSPRPAAGSTSLQRYLDVRRFTMKLCEPLEPEDCVVQSMPNVSPTKWHIAHTTWFFEKFVLVPFADGYQPFHRRYDFLFNSYYNAVGDRVARPKRGLLTRPTFDQIVQYRRHVDEAMAALCEQLTGSEAERAAWLIEVGLNHEQQHQELLLTDIKHVLSVNPLRPVYRDSSVSSPPVDPGSMGWLRFDQAIRWIGHNGPGFAYDNESPRHRVFLEAFELSDRLVTNGEYLEFIEQGGYRNPQFWLDEGWAEVQARQWTAPHYWEAADRGRRVFTLAGLRDLHPYEPVCHVSFYEADAFARWADARLATEAEWETAAGDFETGGNFVENGCFHPAPCGAGAPGSLRQGHGDVWQWTQSPYRPYPGYKQYDGAIGEYNGKFMCNQFVLRGGSCATSRTHIRSTYRNFFHPDARWQFTGIRLARDVQ